MWSQSHALLAQCVQSYSWGPEMVVGGVKMRQCQSRGTLLCHGAKAEVLIVRCKGKPSWICAWVLSAPTECLHPCLLILAAIPQLLLAVISLHLSSVPGGVLGASYQRGGEGVRPCLCGGKCSIRAWQIFFLDGSLLLRGEECTRLPLVSSLCTQGQSDDAAACGQPDPPPRGSTTPFPRLISTPAPRTLGV